MRTCSHSLPEGESAEEGCDLKDENQHLTWRRNESCGVQVTWNVSHVVEVIWNASRVVQVTWNESHVVEVTWNQWRIWSDLHCLVFCQAVFCHYVLCCNYVNEIFVFFQSHCVVSHCCLCYPAAQGKLNDPGRILNDP